MLGGAAARPAGDTLLPMTTLTQRWSWPELRRDRVLFENADAIVLDKPPGLSVTGERHDTDVVELAREAGERLMPVHRIDKVTSGVVLLARNTAAHGPLTRQFAARTVEQGLPRGRARHGAARTVHRGPPAHGRPEEHGADRRAARPHHLRRRVGHVAPARRRRHERQVRLPLGDASATDSHESGETTVLLANPVTGRRHQIRVHLAWTGSPILGDPLFAATSGHADAERTYLHSWRLALDVPWAGGRAEYTADPGLPSSPVPTSRRSPSRSGAACRRSDRRRGRLVRRSARPPGGRVDANSSPPVCLLVTIRVVVLTVVRPTDGRDRGAR